MTDIERFNSSMISGHTTSKEIDSGICFTACQLKEHDAAIAKAERERVLELFNLCLQEEGFFSPDYNDTIVMTVDVKWLIASLRGKWSVIAKSGDPTCIEETGCARCKETGLTDACNECSPKPETDLDILERKIRSKMLPENQRWKSGMYIQYDDVLRMIQSLRGAP